MILMVLLFYVFDVFKKLSMSKHWVLVVFFFVTYDLNGESVRNLALMMGSIVTSRMRKGYKRERSEDWVDKRGIEHLVDFGLCGILGFLLINCETVITCYSYLARA